MKDFRTSVIVVWIFSIGFAQAQEIAIVSSVSSIDDGNVVSNTYDNNLNTRWSALGDGEWAQWDLGSFQNFNELRIAFYLGNTRTSTFDIQVSADGSNWTLVQTGLVSSGTTLDLQSFVVPNQNTRYIRYIGHGNSSNTWNSITEIEIINNIVADTQAPTAAILSGTVQSQTTADLSWSGATDDVGVTGYNIFKDGTLDGTLGNVSTYQVTGLTASTTYDFTVTTLDAAANESVASNTVSVTTDSSGSSGGSTVWAESSGDISYTTGNVGIGTNTIPTDYRLAVSGKIISEELKVQLQATWPDYVFKEGYDLPSLDEVQQHITEKGHLPNIPTAKVVMEHGIEVGEMHRLLLEKIEELTLYTLEQNIQIKQLNTKVLKQQQKLEQLMNSLSEE
ncbi:discoidin domain-containing protein [Allomuricauda sp. R78024]|uniref:discoidin domain-containing protein n=1 Tax=Allomuricauda sp. R78024 TaxID=3093867 RepID=UPI0037C63989